MRKGKLCLIPVPIAQGQLDHLPDVTLSVVRRLRFVVAEHVRSCRRFLKLAGTDHPLDEIVITENNKQQTPDLRGIFQPTSAGMDIGLVSDAERPGIADPGSEVVSQAHELGVQVVPLTGPSSIFLALMSSGMGDQNFSFVGYLPQNQGQLTSKLRHLEKLSWTHGTTQVFIETPYRNMRILKTMLSTLSPQTQLCISCRLTAEDEYVMTRTIADWKKTQLPELHQREAVFLVSAQ